MKVLGKTDTEFLLNTSMNYVFSELQRTTLPFKTKPQPISLKAVVGPKPVLVCLFTGWLCYVTRQKGYCQDTKETKQLAVQQASSQTLQQLNLEMEMVSCAFSYQLEYMHM